MTGRPTPEEIAKEVGDRVIVGVFTSELERHGYRIVHPDDVLKYCDSVAVEWEFGWNACRDYIFGHDEEES